MTDALSRKERVKPRRVRAMAMTIQYGVRGMILAAQSKAFKQENVSLVGSVMDEAHASRHLVHPGADKKYYNLHDMYWWPGMKKDIAIYCPTNANLHVPLDEIKVDKTLHFVEEPIEIMDREIKKLKHRKISLVEVRWNSKCGPEFTWEHEDQMRIRYQQLFVDRVIEPFETRFPQGGDTVTPVI
ncbi:putative reverse transcriptase domain-containing protein [Tanacetum coccineum]